MKRLTAQQRAQRWVSNYLPGNEHPYYAEAGYLAGFTAGRRDRAPELRELRTELARTQTLLDGATRVASVYKTEMQKLQRELGRNS